VDGPAPVIEKQGIRHGGIVFPGMIIPDLGFDHISSGWRGGFVIPGEDGKFQQFLAPAVRGPDLFFLVDPDYLGMLLENIPPGGPGMERQTQNCDKKNNISFHQDNMEDSRVNLRKTVNGKRKTALRRLSHPGGRG
jgi:hypothetical protein